MTVLADPLEFAGKRVLITGGTKGLGRAAVERFLAGGARVITSARSNPDPLDGVEFVEGDNDLSMYGGFGANTAGDNDGAGSIKQVCFINGF